MRRLLATSFAVVLTAAACSSSDDPVETTDATAQADAEAATADEAEPATDEAPTSGDARSIPQLEFTAATVDGGELVGTDYVGTDTVFWFWAPW